MVMAFYDVESKSLLLASLIILVVGKKSTENNSITTLTCDKPPFKYLPKCYSKLTPKNSY